MSVEKQKKKIIFIFSIFFLFLFGYSAVGKVPTGEDKISLLKKFNTMQVPFMENKGQINDNTVKYYAKMTAGNVFITKGGEMVYSLHLFTNAQSERINSEAMTAITKTKIRHPAPRIPNEESKGWMIKEILAGSSISKVKGEGITNIKVNCFKGKNSAKWLRDIKTYQQVSLGEVYKGVELKIKAYGKDVEKLFFLKPGADLENIKIKIEGGEKIRINKNGELEIVTPHGLVKFTKPLAYQEYKEKKKYVEAAYTIKGNEYGFQVGEYDRRKELIIDPLLASTFLGGSNYECAMSIAKDSGGSVYVAGCTDSTDFPVITDTYDINFNGGQGIFRGDVFVSKFNGDLSQLLASTFLGGENDECATRLKIDSNGNIYLTGYTYSEDFPATTGAYDTTYNGGRGFSGIDVFVSKLNGDLSQLLASTFLGDTYKEWPYSMALDTGGNVYVAGSTDSEDFPVTTGAYDRKFNGDTDAFISKFNGDLTQLLGSTFLGDEEWDEISSMALDTGGNVYVAGSTDSEDFPVTTGAYDTFYYEGDDLFVSKFNPDLTQLLASTFIGGKDDDLCSSGMEIDTGGNVYVTGTTYSTDFPTTSGAYDTSFNGTSDVFVSKFNPDLTQLLASTFMGGNLFESARLISKDSSGNIYVIGSTGSTDFPTTEGAYDTMYGLNFISKLNGGLNTILASTLFPGKFLETICIDLGGNVYVAGCTDLDDFPTTSGAYDTIYHGYDDVFISKLDSDISASTQEHYIEVSPAMYHFGDVYVGDSGYATFEISTKLDCIYYHQSIQIGEIKIKGSNASEFNIYSDYCSYDVLPIDIVFGGCINSCNFYVTFLPESMGPKIASISIPYTYYGVEYKIVMYIQGVGTKEFSSICPVEEVAKNGDEIDILRKFRDDVLTKTDKGSEYISSYYRHSREITSILQKDRELMKKAGELLSLLLPEIKLILTGKNAAFLDSKTEDSLMEFLNQFNKKASPGLKNVINKLKNDMELKSDLTPH
ncbi:MAG: SBBP repeat-containing protein [Thermodesulfobacteriota bacterium]|nr:SBBP repeat-containing protein [Thermodesulfobacteriota bacterium]